MKILIEYTLNYLKKNRKNTISILIAITIGTILLSTVVLATYMAWNYDITESVLERGNYHGSFTSYIDKSQIPYLKENQKVDKVYLRTEFYSSKIDMKRPYLNISYLDREYWNNMYEKNSILEGRVPNNSDEIVVMGNFLKENPQYKIGDKINVKLGYRQEGKEKIDPFDFIHEDENFIGEKNKEYTIVGTISGKSLSYEPYYGGLGFLDESSIGEGMKFFPYLRMKNPRKVYKDLPEIGKNLGFTKGKKGNSEGSYNAEYNMFYLKLQGIFPPWIKLSERIPLSILVFFISILVVIFLFVIIIYNVFTVWSNNRLKQLGILKSIGATPRQIKRTVKIEAVFSSIIPIIIGVVLGHLFCYIMIDRINNIVKDFNISAGKKVFELSFKTSPIIVGIIMILSFLTILLSINKPARKLSKILPIEAIKHSGLDYEHMKKKEKKANNYGPNNIISSLVRDSLNGNKKGFRTTIISIAISFVIMFISLVGIGIAKADKKLNSMDRYYTMNVQVLTNELADENIFKEIESIPEVKESIVYKDVYLNSKIKSKYASEEFKNTGGFESIDLKRYDYLWKIDNDYMIPVNLIGLDHDNFDKYVKSQGGNPEEYYDKEKPKAVLLNLVKEDMNQPLARTKFIPYLNNVDSLCFNESYGGKGYSFNIDIGLKTSENPLKDSYLMDYGIYIFVPKDVLNSLMENFALPGDYSHSERMKLLVDEKNINKVKEGIKDISKYYLPEDDYSIWSILDDEAEEKMVNKIFSLVTFSIVFFLGVIGVSNAYSSINNNLRNRRREFAMLKSMGITKDGLSRMLNLEGIYYSIYPFIFSIPISLLLLAIIVKVKKIFTVKDILMFLDYKVIIGYVVVIFMSVYLAYYFGIRKIEKDEIVDVLKDESI
ncbi:ABC transporter permease [Anaerosalibacter massiliensis]|uniref:ABC transporter permease n=1 Tax=Anaerosalibacter massiliensis TaxID=1347392 RepID=A0A9X2S6U2_9FIRM|nr:ABC transporter permease [Anaerosalibacter massiliensis]MCR2044027.1 ABC transporter permease [Anaerosalibacter massiliensis]